jgi:hypothetical protein
MQLTRQEIVNIVFDKVKVKSVNSEGVCKYGGTGCALGVLFGPELSQQLDQYADASIRTLALERKVTLPDYVYTNLDFLEYLQECHDVPPKSDFLPNFHWRLAQLCYDNNLVMPCN